MFSTTEDTSYSENSGPLGCVLQERRAQTRSDDVLRVVLPVDRDGTTTNHKTGGKKTHRNHTHTGYFHGTQTQLFDFDLLLGITYESGRYFKDKF